MKTGKKYNEPCDTALEYFSRGNFKKLVGDYRGALNDFNDAIALKPTFWEAYYQRGNIKSALDHQKDAESDFNKAIELIFNTY